MATRGDLRYNERLSTISRVSGSKSLKVGIREGLGAEYRGWRVRPGGWRAVRMRRRLKMSVGVGVSATPGALDAGGTRRSKMGIDVVERGGRGAPP